MTSRGLPRQDASHPPSGFIALSKQDDPQRWAELIGADEPVITQVDEGRTAVGDTGWSPSSSCSKPSIVVGMLAALDAHSGHSVLEIGAGTGWNAALLGRRVGQRGRVVSIEVDPWDEAEAAYDWWYEHGRPGLARFGMTMTADTQTVWIDEPHTIVRDFTRTG